MAHSEAKVVLLRVVTILQDSAGVRWKVGELVDWLNEGMVTTATLRNDATARTVQVDLMGGDYYKLDDLLPLDVPPPLRFLRLIRNVSGNSKLGAIRMASITAMNAILPGWRSVPSNINVLNYLTDPEDTTGFYVFPPAPPVDPLADPPDEPARVELMYSALPEPIVAPETGGWEAVTGELSTETTFDTALVEYILSRAFSKDTEFGGNGQRAAAHFANYQQALGYEAQGNVAAKSPQKAPA